jgi:hypothetical protein
MGDVEEDEEEDEEVEVEDGAGFAGSHGLQVVAHHPDCLPHCMQALPSLVVAHSLIASLIACRWWLITQPLDLWSSSMGSWCHS